ncbi:MAG: UDP-3-O-acyl-N-acetylglucosamine deacetylase [Pseudomonadales bacterium]
MLQTTINRSVHAIGIGVHGAAKVRMTLRPAPENTGIVFVRSDRGDAVIEARAHRVCDTLLSTSVGQGDVRVSTVEHLMSALWGLGVDNLIVELNGEELPILDGSAAPFVRLLKSVGLRRQSALRKFIRIRREIEVRHGDAVARLRPFAGFLATYTFVADHPVYNRYPKSASIDFGAVSYEDAVAGARSFGLMSELAAAQAANRCLGSSLENAVGIDDQGILNPEGLRFDDEFVKHKVLDAIGDLYLLGGPLLGEFTGYKSGHTLNNRLALALLQTPDAWDLVTFGSDPLRVTSPHRETESLRARPAAG